MKVKEFLKKITDKGATLDENMRVYWQTSEGDSVWLSVNDVEVYHNPHEYCVCLGANLRKPVGSLSYHTKLGTLTS